MGGVSAEISEHVGDGLGSERSGLGPPRGRVRVLDMPATGGEEHDERAVMVGERGAGGPNYLRVWIKMEAILIGWGGHISGSWQGGGRGSGRVHRLQPGAHLDRPGAPGLEAAGGAPVGPLAGVTVVHPAGAVGARGADSGHHSRGQGDVGGAGIGSDERMGVHTHKSKQIMRMWVCVLTAYRSLFRHLPDKPGGRPAAKGPKKG